MDVDALVLTLGKDGCVFLGIAAAAVLALAVVSLSVLAYNVAELRHRERLEAARLEDPDRATREAAEQEALARKREERAKLLAKLREDGFSWSDAREWLRVHGLD
jgi:flagellar biosynthesis/type III secretory pathway M-ring protein FliF/YscJ